MRLLVRKFLSVTLAKRRLAAPIGAFALAILVPVLAPASDTKLSDVQRQQIIRVFLAEHPFVHRALPRGKAGIRIEEEKITPSETELNAMVAQFGPAAKPGDRAKITAVKFQRDGILFEINGGPLKRKRLRDRISIGVGGVNTSAAGKPQQSTSDGSDADVYTDSTGSSVLLVLKQDTASLTTDHMKDLLAPVLDFKAMTVAEAYQKSLPPVLAAAVKNHHALVGMDKEMVTYALGRPPHRLRETKEGKDIEEWIYGAPPEQVEFIRFLNDKVVSIEEMKVTGEKIVRTQDEVGNLGGTLDASAQKHTRPDAVAFPADEDRQSAPSLLRPDEKPAIKGDSAARDPNPMPSPDSPTSPTPPSPN
ncbi:MAG TPA: hypothetical protein VM578_05505 [Candidatus Saccharimonadales bacterium]|nr:hypothetical protein [Candidatus Saccharimonadales bacterium]